MLLMLESHKLTLYQQEPNLVCQCLLEGLLSLEGPDRLYFRATLHPVLPGQCRMQHLLPNKCQLCSDTISVHPTPAPICTSPLLSLHYFVVHFQSSLLWTISLSFSSHFIVCSPLWAISLSFSFSLHGTFLIFSTLDIHPHSYLRPNPDFLLDFNTLCFPHHVDHLTVGCALQGRIRQSIKKLCTWSGGVFRSGQM